jgi:hypothetical protein
MAFSVDKVISHYAKHGDVSKTSKFEVFVFPPPTLVTAFPVAEMEGFRFQCETAELPGYNLNTVDGRVYGNRYAVAASPVYNDLTLTFSCAGDLWEKQFFDYWMAYIMPPFYVLEKYQQPYVARYKDDYAANMRVRAYVDASTYGTEKLLKKPIKKLSDLASAAGGALGSKLPGKLGQFASGAAQRAAQTAVNTAAGKVTEAINNSATKVLEKTGLGRAVQSALLQPVVAQQIEFVDIFPTSIAPITLNWGDDGVNKLSVTFKYSYWREIEVD